MDRWLLVVNPESGNADGDAVDRLTTAFRSAGREVEVVPVTDDLDGLTDVAGVVVAGGDGTVMSVVNALVARENSPPLAILPLGTANLVARALDIPLEADAAIEVALTGGCRDIDVGTCNGRAFVLGAGFGSAERFVTQTPDEAKRKIGPVAYLWTLVRELRACAISFHIEAEEEEPRTIRGIAAVVANIGGLGKRLALIKSVQIDDGRLHVCVLRPLRLASVPRLAVLGALGRMDEAREIEVIPITRGTVTATPPAPVQLDGDEAPGAASYRFEALARKLTVIAPR